jgi:hypothetical protein
MKVFDPVTLTNEGTGGAMAKTEQQRQKKLAKKRGKEIRARREMAKKAQAMNSVIGRMQWASRFPVAQCLVGEGIQDGGGMGVIYLTRQINGGQIAMMFLLIDSFCLGVKDAGARFCTPSEFDELIDRAGTSETLRPVAPEFARKLAEDALAYAQTIGFSPHADYRKVAPFWGDIDASRCAETFTFGLDGRPNFVAGPFDDDARQNFVFRRLRETVGEGNFGFIISPDAAGEMFDMPDFESLGQSGFDSLEFDDDEGEDFVDDHFVDDDDASSIDAVSFSVDQVQIDKPV